MRKLVTLLISSFLLLTPSAAAFSDVQEGNGHYVPVTWLKEQGIVEGYSDGTFKPYEKVNRAEALTMLIKATGQYDENFVPEGPAPSFTDVTENAWYWPYIVFGAEKGVINSEGAFNPDRNVNLAESLRIFLESFGNLIFPEIIDYEYIFADTPEDAWFTKYTIWAGSRETLDINSSNQVRPEQEMTRGRLADIIYKTFQSQNKYHFGKATWYGAAVQGNHTASGEIFDYNLMTAAHKTLPFGTIVEVTNLANGKSIEVKINDRGPYGPGRVIDLSSGAFKEIASLGAGIINVEYKIVE